MPIFKKLKKPPVGTIAANLPVNKATGLSIDGSEAGNTGFAGFRHDTITLGAIASTGAGNNPVLANIDLHGTNAASSSALWSGAAAFSPQAGDAPGVAAAAADGATPAAIVVDDTADHVINSAEATNVAFTKHLAPTITVNAANPTDVIFTVGGLEPGDHGTVTFTDTTGHQDVVNDIASDGTYSANLSNLANGTLTYLLSVTTPSGSVITVDPTAMLGDGSANAPAGPPQLPNLLSGEDIRPAWEVAGVDYAVGVPSGTLLTDWENLSGPGISIEGNLVRVDNTSGEHINGVDFSLDGGASLAFINSPGGIVTNCNFQVIVTSSIIDADVNSPGLTVEYCNIQGGSDGSSLIGAKAGGNVTVEYNYLYNFPQHALEIDGGTNLVYEYNLIENGGTAPGAHLNYLQWQGSGVTDSALVEYNTTYQTPLAGGEGFQFDLNDTNGNSGTMVSPTFAYNTMIAAPTLSMSYLLHGTSAYSDSNPDVTPISGTASVYDNYFDIGTGTGSNQGAYGVFYDSSWNGWTISDNYDMVTGNIINGDNSETPPPASDVTTVVASPSSGTEVAGNTITLTLNMDKVFTVAGTPTLTLNDGGTATYTGGFGTKVLTFSYTVGASDNAVSSLAITQVNLPNGATVTDAAGNAANLSGALTTFSGLQIAATTTPTVASVAASGSGITGGAGNLDAGHVVTLTVNLTEAVTVAGGTPTLTLNDGGVATYTGGSGTAALTFSYTVAAGQNTAALAVTAVNLGTATVQDGAGNAANLTGAVTTLSGLQIDTTTPSTPTNLVGTAVSSSQINLSWTASTDNVGVTGYEIFRNGVLIGTSATNSYSDTGLAASTQYAYTVETYDAAGNISAQSVSANAITQAQAAWSNLPFPTQTGNFTASFDSTPSQSGADIVIGLASTTAAAYTDLAAIVRFNSSNTIDVRNGSAYGADVSVPYSAGTNYHFRMVVSLATDTYSVYVTPQGGSETALAANYAFRTEQATDTSLSDVGEIGTPGSAPVLNFSILNTATPAITSLVESPSIGDLNAGKTATLTLNLSETVTVAGGTPTLTLNDGGNATYTGGSGTSALTFSYTVGASDGNVASLAATAVNLNGATIKDSGGNAANLSLSGISQTGPQIDTTAPSVTSVAASGTGITAGAGDLNAGNTVTLTMNLTEAVTVAGGTPTLTLNDGGVATYTGGSGTTALTFGYTTASGQNTLALAITAVNLPSGATITDSAGNAASLTGAVTTFSGLMIDTTPPAAPVITGDTIVNTNEVMLTGTALDQGVGEAGDPVNIYDGTTLLGTTATSATGGWTYTSGPLSYGSHVLTATVTDLAGNTSAASKAVDLSIAPAATADMILRNGTNGDYEIYDIGSNTLLAAYPLGQVNPVWQVAGLGGFYGTDTSDMILRNSNTGAFEVYDISNNNITSAASMGQVGLKWQVSGFGDFSSNPGESDMLMRKSNTGAFEIYDISNNAITSAASMGAVGLEWTVAGFGDFSGNPGESDMLMRNSNTGAFEVYDISNNAVTSAASMGAVGLEWTVAGFGDFSGNANETDMLMRNSNTGAFYVFDISHNAITSAAAMGAVGSEWTVAGFGDFSGNANETDMLMRNSNTGAFEVYDISHNTITSAASMGQVGLEWQVGGIAADPPAASSAASIALLVQAMAGFPSDGAAIDQGPINQASQQGISEPSLFAAPSLQHGA